MQSFEKLTVWRGARALVNAVYDASGGFPIEERFGITSQIRRAAVSVAANIAEGSSRSTSRDFARFLDIAIGSVNEVHCLALIAEDRRFLSPATSALVIRQIRVLRAQLVRLLQAVRA